jgi:phage tail tape-measure protein
MEQYLHRVLGFYATRSVAESVSKQLIRRGVPTEKLIILEPERDGASAETKADSDDVVKKLLRGGAIGTLVGALAGAAGTVALAIANITLFIASPVLGALYLIGWGGSLGAFIGAVAGSQSSKGDTADLVRDALASGQVVLVAHTATEQQTTHAQQIIAASMRERGMTPMAGILSPVPN